MYTVYDKSQYRNIWVVVVVVVMMTIIEMDHNIV